VEPPGILNISSFVYVLAQVTNPCKVKAILEAKALKSPPGLRLLHFLLAPKITRIRH